MRFILSFLLVSVTFLSLHAQNYHGIDVSHHQHKIDWSQVAKDDVDFVYIKATEGATWTDPKFKTLLEGAKKENILVGAYHFITTSTEASAQKDFNYNLLRL